MEQKERPITSVRDAGALVRQARSELDLNQSNFGALAGVGRRFVSELENGKPSITFGTAIEVLQAAGWDLVAHRR